MENVTGIMLSQMAKVDKHAQVSVKEGIKCYKQKAIDTVLKEYAQLDNKTIFDPKKQESLTSKQKSNALNLITMIKEKRFRKIKGRTCAGRRKKRKYISKEEVASPTV